MPPAKRLTGPRTPVPTSGQLLKSLLRDSGVGAGQSGKPAAEPGALSPALVWGRGAHLRDYQALQLQPLPDPPALRCQAQGWRAGWKGGAGRE